MEHYNVGGPKFKAAAKAFIKAKPLIDLGCKAVGILGKLKDAYDKITGVLS